MDSFDREIELASDPWLGWARNILTLGGVVYLLFALFGGPLGSLQVWLDGDPGTSTVWRLIVTGVAFGVTLVIGLPVAIAHFVASSGLEKGRKWAWFLGIGIGVLYLPFCLCLPFGVVILYGLLNSNTRALFA